MEKVCILTFQDAINYGAILQAYALQTIIRKFGFYCDIIDYDNNYFKYEYADGIFSKNVSLKKRLRLVLLTIIKPKSAFFHFKNASKIKKIKKFINNRLVLSKRCDKKAISNIVHNYDKIIVGSDQVWNMKLSNYDTTYYLDFINDSVKKYSYAASLGKSNITEFERDQMKKNLVSFRKILIREEEGQQILKNQIGLDSTVVLDPTLLLPKKEWENLIDKNIENDYILLYLIQDQINLVNVAEQYAEKFGYKIYTLTDIKGKKYKSFLNASVEEFLSLIYNAKCIFTTSFHGLVFSINFNKEFYFELSNKISNNNSRMIDIVNRIGLEDREILNSNIKFEKINYNSINDKITKLRNDSIIELKSILND